MHFDAKGKFVKTWGKLGVKAGELMGPYFLPPTGRPGETPLHRAAAWGSPEVIECLLDARAEPTIRDAINDTPLSWASWYRRGPVNGVR